MHKQNTIKLIQEIIHAQHDCAMHLNGVSIADKKEYLQFLKNLVKKTEKLIAIEETGNELMKK